MKKASASMNAGCCVRLRSRSAGLRWVWNRFQHVAGQFVAKTSIFSSFTISDGFIDTTISYTSAFFLVSTGVVLEEESLCVSEAQQRPDGTTPGYTFGSFEKLARVSLKPSVQRCPTYQLHFPHNTEDGGPKPLKSGWAMKFLDIQGVCIPGNSVWGPSFQ